MAETIQLSESSFDEKVLKSDNPVLIDFWAEWCGPCKTLAPVLDELVGEYRGKFSLAKLNVEEYPRLAAGLGVRGLPTLLIFSKGKEKQRIVGAFSKAEIKKKIDSILK